MERVNRNTLFETILMICALVYLVVSSFYVPLGVTDSTWIPIIAGLVDTEVLFTSKGLSYLLSFISILLLIFSVSFILKRTMDLNFHIPYMSLFMLLIIFSDNRSLYFNQIYPVALCFVWAQYCLLYGQLFFSFLLLSLGALFYAPFIWLFPVYLFLILFNPMDLPKNLVKAISGFLIPVIYLLSFRFIRYDDTYEFIYKFIKEMFFINDELFYIHFPTLFLILCLIFISVHSVLHSLKKLYRKGRDVVNIVKLESISLCILFLFFILFSHQHTVPLVILVSIPVGVLYSYYFAHRTGNYLSNVEIILLVCALIIARSSNFIN